MSVGEVVKLRWSEVDREAPCSRIEETTEGASVRPIRQAVLPILDGLPRAPGSAYVLPAARGGQGPFVSLDEALERVVSKAGLEGVTAHTLRRSFASTAGDLGYSDSTIGAMLGHAGHGVTSRSIHHRDAVLIAAADRVAMQIAGAMSTAKKS